MFTRTKSRSFGCYEIIVTIKGPDQDQVKSAFGMFEKVMEIKGRDFPQDEKTPMKKPCGCSGS